VLLSFQRGILVVGQTTRPLTWATVVEVGGIALLFPLLGWKLGVVGVTAAVSAFLVGRAAGNLYLIAPCLQALRGPGRLRPSPSPPPPSIRPARVDRREMS